MRRGTCLLTLTLAVLASGFITVVSAQFSNATFTRFQTCAGLPMMNSSERNEEHIDRLKGLIDEAFDLYSFLGSGRQLQPTPELSLNASDEGLHDVNFTRTWFHVKFPRLVSVSQQYLSCLSTSNFTCQTYQAVVSELNGHFQSMDPARQRIVYMFFLRPFVERNDTGGCVHHGRSSVEWLQKNFGSFSIFARLREFTALNRNFSGLAVLPLLSPEQKAEVLLHASATDLGNNTVRLLFESLLTPLLNHERSNHSVHNASMANATMYNMTDMASRPQEHFETFQGLLSFLRPLGRFIRSVVSNVQGNGGSGGAPPLAQAVVNWTLAELRGHLSHNFTLGSESVVGQTLSFSTFNVSSVESWFSHVVVPLLRRFLPRNQTEVPHDLTPAFDHVFLLKADMNVNTSGSMDVCQVGRNDSLCSVSRSAENLAVVLRCVAHSNESLTRDSLKTLVSHLCRTMDESPAQHQMMNGSRPSKPTDLFGELPANKLSPEDLGDPDFVRFWFRVKLRPLLPTVSEDDLSCLSTRRFSCHAYQALVMDLSDHHTSMNPMRQRLVYSHFIHPFLLSQGRYADMLNCTSKANGSLDTIEKNFGRFSVFAPLQQFFDLHINFSALEALPALSPQQIADLVLRPHTPPPQREAVINRVFDHLTNDPRLSDFLRHLKTGAREAHLSCESYAIIFHRLHMALSSATAESASFIRECKYFLMQTAPADCKGVGGNFTSGCPMTMVNESEICAGVNSTVLLYPAAGNTSHRLCNVSLLPYACLPLLSHVSPEQLAQLISCKLCSNVTYRPEIWKLFFTKFPLSHLNGTLHMLRNMSLPVHDPSVGKVLDALGELLLGTFTDRQLQDERFVHDWFHGNLRPFLSSASEKLLSCLSGRNFSCETFSHVVKEFAHQFHLMDERTQRSVYENFIYSFLMRNHSSDPACLSRTNGSEEWLRANFGPYSVFAPLHVLQTLNHDFLPLEALPALSPQQIADLVLRPHTPPPQREAVINRVFDHLTNDPRLTDFLRHLKTGAMRVNLSCESYDTIFSRLDRALSSSPPGLDAPIREAKASLMRTAPEECTRVPLQIGCSVTPVNERQICDGVNTTTLQQYLAMNMTQMACCNFSIQQYACLPQLSHLRPDDISRLLRCKLSSNMTYTKEIWKLFFSKVSGNLDKALQLFSNMTNHMRGGSVVLDVLGEVRLDQLRTQDLRNPHVIHTWFRRNLRPFLPHASTDFLSCLSTKNFSCGTIQIIVEALGDQSDMDRNRKQMIYSNVIEAFLSRNDTEDPACVNNSTNSADWLARYFGPFRHCAPLSALRRLNRHFTVGEVLPLLGVAQLAEVAVTPGQLTDRRNVNIILTHVPSRDLGRFFDIVSPQVQDLRLLLDVRSALLQQVLDRANLSESSVSDAEVLVWMGQRLRPLLHNLTEEQVAPLFNIVRHRACNTSQNTVELLNSIQHTLSNGSQKAIQHQILMSLRGSTPLRCYRNGSFFLFLKRSFRNFPFPRLNSFLSLIPPGRESELINTMGRSELGSFLRQPEVVDNKTELCTIFSNFNRTPEFLEKEEIPEGVRRSVLPCVWPLALSSDEEAEVQRWFGRRLRNYLRFLDRELLNSSTTLNASCPSFRKLVSVLGANLSSDVTQEDVYNTIKTYLNTDSVPKCYSPADPKINSTAWFVQYIGVFIPFVTLDDLDTFGSESTLQLFAVNPLNIQLFNFTGAPQNLTERYTELIFLQNPNFSPIKLPSQLQCGVPGSVYTSLSEAESVTVLGNLNQSCSDVDPEISSALASNIQTVSSEAISALGQESTGLSPAQISVARPSVIVQSLHTLSSAEGWSLGQASAIIQALVSGNFQINTANSLVQLGSLIGGLPTQTITSISSAEILTTVSNPAFVTNMLSAPTIVQRTYVNKIISVNTAPQQLVTSVPDGLADQIPRRLLQFPTSGLNAVTLQRINKKRWKSEQAALFFGTIATGFEDPDQLSEDVLQGFTCTRVRSFSRRKTRRLIRACRRRGGRRKVLLRETQLTCMYNHIRDESPQDFVNYPSDMLLYYNYANVLQVNCRSYFTEAGRADFSVFSKTLEGRKFAMLNNAKSCLGITGTQISRQNVKILGSLCCTLDQNYIQNSDPFILDQLKNCKDFSDQQIVAMENVLINGNTKYGPPARWNVNTLRRLGILPLYLRENLWMRFRKRDKRRFLKGFMRRLRKGKTPKRKLKKLFKALRKSLRSKRAAVNGCPDTPGHITQVTISDDAFPFGYDATSFNHCLTTQVLTDNLASLAEKVDDDDFQLIILEKLHQAYPQGLSDQQVQLLGSVSRMASVEHLNTWNITSVDSLAALMDSSDGDWDPDKSRVILTRYLGIHGNTLGASELNSVGGPNLCSLDSGVLQGIHNGSLKDADTLDISNCSVKQKKTLFSVAKEAFPISFTNRNADVITTYQLIEPYLGGADSSYIRGLTTSNVTMTISTFIALDESVVLNLTVSEVQGLLGSNLDDLKTFENDSVVQSWVSRQLQAELDVLRINITGGLASPATLSPTLGTNATNSTDPATTVAVATTAVMTTVSATTSGQSKGACPAPLLYALIASFVTMQTWGLVIFSV